MTEVAFWFENGKIFETNLSSPNLGNSGVGGTEYQFVLLAHLLSTLRPSEINVTFFVEKIQLLPSQIKQIQVNSLAEAYEVALELKVDYLIFRPRRDLPGEIRRLEFSGTKLIPWLHITPKRAYLDWLGSTEIVHRVIFVGDDQRMRTIDHQVYKIASTIYNSSNGSYSMSKERKKDTVVFVGALVPRKGFHLLAQAWNDVRKAIPDAKLLVIGSGSLYDRSARLGPLNLAEESYEALIAKYLFSGADLEFNGVNFLGNLGPEKKHYIETATVGVVNPSGLTENCPMSVVEFYQSGIPVVSSVKYGIRDMVIHGETGLRCRGTKELSKALIQFLDGTIDSEEIGQNGMDFAKQKFSPHSIVNQWMRVFKSDIEPPLKMNGYWIHKIFARLKGLHLLPSKLAMVEDQKIFIANLRVSLTKTRK